MEFDENVEDLMGRALVMCARCKARKFEGEVRYDSTVKDFVCKNETKCTVSQLHQNQVQKVRRRRMETTKLSKPEDNL